MRRDTVIRPGNWLLAVHRLFTAKPLVERIDENGLKGFSVWWLWFEISRAAPAA